MVQEEALQQTKVITLDSILEAINKQTKEGYVSVVFFNQYIKDETKFELAKLGYRLKTGVDHVHAPFTTISWL